MCVCILLYYTDYTVFVLQNHSNHVDIFTRAKDADRLITEILPLRFCLHFPAQTACNVDDTVKWGKKAF